MAVCHQAVKTVKQQVTEDSLCINTVTPYAMFRDQLNVRNTKSIAPNQFYG